MAAPVAASETSASLPTEVSELSTEGALGRLRSELESALFADAERHARALLAERTLRASQRNDTLELLAIAQIAAREEAAARLTLDELFARDPEHTPRLRDPGPSVEATFERIRAGAPRALAVPLTVSAMRDAHERVIVQIALGPGRDAVESVHVFAHWPATSKKGAPASAIASEDAIEASHLVVERELRDSLSIALPSAPSDARRLALYVEARAPSGAVLGRDGSLAAPLVVQLDPTPPCVEKVPLRRRWWLWTSVAIVVAGAAVGGGLAAR